MMPTVIGTRSDGALLVKTTEGRNAKGYIETKRGFKGREAHIAGLMERSPFWDMLEPEDRVLRVDWEASNADSES
jgi:hypothetical protein